MNQHIDQRLAGIQQGRIGAHQAGWPLSSASKGSEREHFIDAFLSQFPPPLHFGHGDVTDAPGRRGGQLEVVVEYPLLPSLPVIGQGSSRIYLAEGVAAAIEVKSDVAGCGRELKRKLSARGDEAGRETCHPLAIKTEAFRGYVRVQELRKG